MDEFFTMATELLKNGGVSADGLLVIIVLSYIVYAREKSKKAYKVISKVSNDVTGMSDNVQRSIDRLKEYTKKIEEKLLELEKQGVSDKEDIKRMLDEVRAIKERIDRKEMADQIIRDMKTVSLQTTLQDVLKKDKRRDIDIDL